MPKAKVLFVGCHCDDIEIGCGGTISRFRDRWDILCHVLSSTCFGGGEDLKKVCRKSMKTIGVSKVSFSSFDPSHFQELRQKIWESIREIKDEFRPDFVFTHENDEHQDHGVASDETIRNFRRSSIIQYPIARSSFCFSPNMFVSLKKKDIEAKKKALAEYDKIYDKNFLKKKNVEAQARCSGLYFEMKYCESFFARSILVGESGSNELGL
jgi:LmbE family N-acetylglucosaminyl deacetylase